MDDRMCSAEGCERSAYRKGMCDRHYQCRPGAVPCSVDGCDMPVRARGWCDKHYQRWKKHGDPLGKASKVPAADRFYAFADRSGDCWLWTGGISTGGYGSFWDGQRGTYAHIFAYQLLVSPVPAGMVLDHLCRNRACCNPWHLEPVTDRVNILRGAGPSAQCARMTICQRGHELTGPNLYVSPVGKRQCKACRNIRNRARKMINGKRVYFGVASLPDVA